MTIVVIAGTATKNDPAFLSPENNWVLVSTAEEAAGYPDAQLYIDLDFVDEPHRKQALGRLLPKPVLVSAVVPTLRELGYSFIRINGWPGFWERPIHEVVLPEEANADELKGLYKSLGLDFRLVPDTPGMISARILATIINEAYFTREEEVSMEDDIDIAMRLGTNYPMGPFEWGRKIGLDRIAGLLTVLSRENDRYTPCRSLLKAAKSLKYD